MSTASFRSRLCRLSIALCLLCIAQMITVRSCFGFRVANAFSICPLSRKWSSLSRDETRGPIFTQQRRHHHFESRRRTCVAFPRCHMTTFVSGSSSSVDDVDSSAPGIPSEFRKSYQISGVGRKSAVEMLTSTNHAIHSDVPKQMGGSNAAPQPVELLLASLLGCTQATATFVGRQMNPRILLDRLEMDIQAERDERGALELPIDRDPEIPARLQRVTGIVRVYTRNKQPLSDSQLELISHQTEERCPVANMVKSSGCVMDVEWVNGISKEEN